MGDFKLHESLEEGAYKIRCYTNYLKNFDEAWFYQKVIAVRNSDTLGMKEHTGISDKIDLQFFPEGGTFIGGFENRIAFKAIDETGNDVFVRGKVVDSNKKLVTTFESVHEGMGIFKMLPMANTTYTAVIVAGKDSLVYSLPKVAPVGYNLRITDLGKTLKVSVITTTKQLQGRDAYLIMQTNGLPHFSAKGTFDNGSLVAYIKKEWFPTGVAQITLLDEFLTPQCERLVFINHLNSPRISLIFNKEKFQKGK